MPLLNATIVLTVCLMLAGGSQVRSASRSEPVADSVRGFSGTQGVNGWTYGYWDRSADTDKNYDPSTDYRLLEHYGRDPINGLSGHTAFTTGDLWYLNDGVYYTSLWAEGGHPNGTLDLGSYAQVEQWAVRRWTSTTEGPITVTGHAGKVMPWGANWSGGVLTVVVVDGEELFRADVGERGSEYSIDAMVKVGSNVDFLIGPNPSVGVISFTATIWPATE